ncbi:MAG: hypothetical protein QM765_35760 [Myxococcales bacterium]
MSAPPQPPATRPRGGKRFWAALCAATLLLGTLCWLSTGTMALYAATLAHPWEIDGRILNYDHWGYVNTYRFVSGDWEGVPKNNLVGHRVLLFAVAHPLIKWLGFYVGGVLTALALNLVAFVAFVLFVRREWGPTAAYVAMALLCGWPGITFWVGSPYAHAIVVPCVLGIAMLGHALLKAQSTLRVLLLSLGIGVLFTGYDLLNFFLPAILLVLLVRRRFLHAALAFVAMAIPPAVVQAFLRAHDIETNSVMYRTVLGAWLHPGDLKAWWDYLKLAPLVLVQNFFRASFLVLPALFVGLYAWGRWRLRFRLAEFEWAVLLAALAIFLFNNLAPSYDHLAAPNGRIRGYDFARLYLPIFVVLVLYVARLAAFLEDRSKRAILGAAVSLCLACNVAICLSPVLRSKVLLALYVGDAATAVYDNTGKYGRRPLGL